MSNSCIKCKYWERTSSYQGECHRYPPVPTAGRGALWPIMLETDWCGEYVGEPWAVEEETKPEPKPKRVKKVKLTPRVDKNAIDIEDE